jgi:hypothetical protein
LVSVAVWVLTLAVAAGTMLALWHLRAADGASRPPLAGGIAHGILGAAGLVILLLALRGPPRGGATGVESFGTMLVVAGLTGIVMLMLRRKSVTMTIHAVLAVAGYVLLLAWNALG